jgi:hypothetical protein
MRARDIRQALKDKNLDPALLHTLEGLADNDKTLRDQIDALAEMVDKSIELVTTLVGIMSQIQTKVPDMDKMKDVQNVLANAARDMVKTTAKDAIKLKDPGET